MQLRNFEGQDKEKLIEILNDPSVVKYLSKKIPYPYTEEDAKWWISEGSNMGIIRAIVIENELVGCIGITPGQFEYSRSGEIGYWLAKPYWGQGITTLAVKKLVEVVFSETQIERIFASVFDKNMASMQVLKKANFAEEAVLKKAIYKNSLYFDSHIFSILKKTQ